LIFFFSPQKKNRKENRSFSNTIFNHSILIPQQEEGENTPSC